MPRLLAFPCALGVILLVVLLTFALQGSRRGAPLEVLYNRGTGLPLTLEVVQQDLEWRRETAEKLRRLR